MLTAAEASVLAGVRPATVRAWCASARLPAVRGPRPGTGRVEWRIVRADLDRFLAAYPRTIHPHRVDRDVTRAQALRRIASEISGKLDLQTVFGAVLDDAAGLFRNELSGLWLLQPGTHPLVLAAHRGLSQEMRDTVAQLTQASGTMGLRAIRERRIRVIRPDQATHRPIREAYRAAGIETICFVPIIFRDEAVGLITLYHRSAHAWPREERELAGAFADQMAVAIANARLHADIQSLGARLSAISDLAIRLNRIQDVAGIGASILAEAQTLIACDTIRVYRLDQAAGTCEPIAFAGHFMGRENPGLDRLRVKIGQGLTGWVAANNQAIRTGDAAADPRGLTVGSVVDGPESVLAVPMTYEDAVCGVIVLSKVGRDRFVDADEVTMSIFAGYAAQAMVNAGNAERVRASRAELEHQLASQRRLIEVNERLLSTLDPHGVLEMIADSLRSVVSYDTLGLYVVDWEAQVRRAVVARDRYADVILAHASPIFSGITGWAIEHGEALFSNDVHLDGRSVQIPGTPFEPESMLIVPLVVDGRVEGTLNVGRIGGVEAHFTPNEFDLTKLFAAQASLALQNAQAHRASEVRADRDSLTGLSNHGAFQRELGEVVDASDGTMFAALLMDLDDFKVYNDTHGHPAGDLLLQRVAGAITETIREGDRAYRYGGDEFAVVLAGADRTQALDIANRIRVAVRGLFEPGTSPQVRASIGVACYPADGRTKDAIVSAADRSMYLVKPSRRGTDPDADRARDVYLSALNETALELMDRLDPTELLNTIMVRAASLIGVEHGFIYVVEPDGSALVVRGGLGIFESLLGYSVQRGEGASGLVWQTGRPLTIDDYDAFFGRRLDLPAGTFGAVVAAPLTDEGRVVGVIGLASGSTERVFDGREVAALERFAQLASIAFANARLFDAALRDLDERRTMQERLSRGALYDDVTGLPNRVLLEDRIGHALTSGRVDGSESIAVMIVGLDAFDLADERGRGAGDELLRAVGERLRGALRPADTIGRFGGGEFGILLEVTGSADALAVAERVEGRLAAPFRASDRDVLVTAHVGIAVGVAGEAVVDDLLHDAETALVQAKAHPTVRHALSDRSASAAPAGGLDIAQEITRALEGLGRPPVRGPGSRAKRPVIRVGASSGGPPRSPAKRPA
ncbi:MAG TPA: diguanylate cyclase [Candidatus Limnocylindrales bacterium]